MDSPYANRAFAESIGVTFPLLSDRGGEITRAWGLYDETEKKGRRATFLIDKEGRVTKTQFDSEAIDPTEFVEACSIPDR